MEKRVLVTGGAGFIGSQLVDSLLRDDYEVLVVDNFDPFYDRSIKEDNIKEHLQAKSYTFIEADIRDRERINQIFQQWQPEQVVHLAAKAGVRPSVEDPLSYVEINVTGTTNVLDASIKHGVTKFIFASSSSVYGHNEKVPFAETDATLSPASPYAATKIAGEALCKTYSSCFKLPITALRFFTVYGPRQRPDLAIHKFTRKILNDESIPVYGDGTSSRDYTFIDDIIMGIRAAMALKSVGYEVFNLGNDQPTKLIDLISAIETTVGKKAQIDWLASQTGDVPLTWADIEKSKRHLAYSPKTSLDKGLSVFVKWLEQQMYNRSKSTI